MASIFVRFFDWTLPFGWCGLGEAGSDVQLLQSNACEHAPSDGVRRKMCAFCRQHLSFLLSVQPVVQVAASAGRGH